MNKLIIWEGGRNLFKFTDCIDASSEFCPCPLAEVGECIICTQLKGSCFCDCINWKGTCIYQEYIWNNEKSKKSRQFKIYKIKSKRYLRDDILLLKVEVGREMVRELNNIGAFVFLKKPGDGENCSTPISIMECDTYTNEITMAIKIMGLKTKLLSKCEDAVMIKGPYWNGIQGQRFLKDLKNKNVLIAGRGCAVPPAVLAAKKLISKDNNVEVLLEKGRSKQNCFTPYFESMNCHVYNAVIADRTGVLKDDSKELIEKLLKEKAINVVLSAGNDKFHSEIINYIYSINKIIDFATVNNSTMCCGEGICGSCYINMRGNEIKACKQQYNPIEVFLKKEEGG